jgi:hypothetical protein
LRNSPAQQSLKTTLQKSVTKAKFNIAEDAQSATPAQSPAVRSPVPLPLFSKTQDVGKDSHENTHNASEADSLFPSINAAPWSPVHSTQNTASDTQESTQIFTQEPTQSTQPTQATQSFRRSIEPSEDERRDTGESFVSAKEEMASKNASKENLVQMEDSEDEDMDNDRFDFSEDPDAHGTVLRNDAASINGDDTAIHYKLQEFPQPTRVTSEQHMLSADAQDAFEPASSRAHAPEPKNSVASPQFSISAETQDAMEIAEINEDTIVHHDVEDQMDIDDDVRSPSDGSSPVKPLVRKSSLTFASLPAREPFTVKKSMGNRVSRTSHVDQNKARNSQMGRFTGGKSLGGSQAVQAHYDDEMDIDEERPQIRREESETTKIHNKTSTQRLADRINMLKQKNEPPKSMSHHIASAQSSQTQSFTSSQPSHSAQPAQPAYPQLPPGKPENMDEDDDDDWISPIRTAAPAPNPPRPNFSKSYSVPTPKEPVFPKAISVSNPDLSAVVGSTTPAGSPTGKRYMDGPLSASKAKFYSALRAAKEKIIGSSATSAQVKLDALVEGPMRPKLQAQSSSDDVFSPKRNDKPPAGLFSHLRSPSKESLKSTKSTKSSKIATMPGSPVKDDGRRTRSSSEREKQREREAREKEMRQLQRTEDKLKDLREKEQSKASAHYLKTKASAKTPMNMASQQSLRSAVNVATKTPTSTLQQPQPRPGVTRTNTGPSMQEPDSGDEMPPPPPPKSLLPTGQKLREPKRLLKAPSKDTLPKGKPQKIIIRPGYGQAPPVAAAKAAPPPVTKAAPPVPAKSTAPAPRPATAAGSRAGATSRAGPSAPKPAPRVGRPQPFKAAEKPKAPTAQPRADLGAARPVSRMQTVQDANRMNVNVPPVNPAKPPAKRPFQAENDEPIHRPVKRQSTQAENDAPLNRPAKRPSQQPKMNPITPAHAQFAKGKIPFAESVQSAQPQQPQYGNGDDIKLPEIMTDSEDEDSDNEVVVPDWVNTPNLRELLTSQQLVDPEQIFGPIAPLNMEQVFPNKERHKRFRERTSSAYWANDQLTETERRKEREARERIVRDGAWTYNPSPLPPRQQ